MPELLSELNVGLLVATGVLSLLVLWWLVDAAPARWVAVLLLGLLVAGVGGGLIYAKLSAEAERRKAAEATLAARRAAAAEAAEREAQRRREEVQAKLERARREAEERARAEQQRKAEEASRRAKARLEEERRKAEREEERRHLEQRRLAAELERRRVELQSRQRQEADERLAELRAVEEKVRKEAERRRLAEARGDRTGSEPPSGRADRRGEGEPRSVSPDGAGDKDNDKWHVVPVFYGTDRTRVDGEKRIQYSRKRGKRLEVGRALVTIPKIHKVPNIERPWVYRIPVLNIVIHKEKEDPEKHFTMQEVKHLTTDEFAALAQERISKSKAFAGQGLVFVHGFNTTFDYAVYRSAQLTYDLKFDGGSFVYSWPSRGEVSPLGYSADRESAEQAAPYLEAFLTLVAKRTGVTSLTVIAHSMGSKLLLQVLQKLRLRNDTDVKISQLILAAPDVDRDTFAGLAREIKGISAGGVTLYAASNDLALEASRQFWGGIARAGDVPPEGPIVVEGIDTIDVTTTSTDIFSLNHAGYAQSKALLDDIRALMKHGYKAPDARNATLLSLTTPLGMYWKFP